MDSGAGRCGDEEPDLEPEGKVVAPDCGAACRTGLVADIMDSGAGRFGDEGPELEPEGKVVAPDCGAACRTGPVFDGKLLPEPKWLLG